MTLSRDPRPTQMQLTLAADNEMSRAEWLAAEEVPVLEPIRGSRDAPRHVDARPGSTDDDSDPDWCSFRAATRVHGYGNDHARMLFRTRSSLDIDGATATAWMHEGFTPWAASVWIAAGVDAPAEAQELRRWHLSAEEGYWARRDGMTQPYLRARRQLVEWMARSRSG